MKKKLLLVIMILFILIGGYYLLKGKEKDDNVHVDVSDITPSKEIKQVMSKNATFKFTSYPQTKEEKTYDQLLQQFLKNKMLVDGSFITNYKVTKNQSKGELATGHDRLSESSGLWLRHLALTGQQKAYDAFYKETKKHFYKGGQFSYRLNANGTLSPVNASLDDLRIMRSLIEAAQVFGDTQYIDELKKLVKPFKKQSIQGEVMVDFYDIDKKQASHTISLYYLSIKTMGYIYRLAGLDDKYLQYQYHLLKNGYISDDFPFYYAQYSYKKNNYVKKDKINVIESLLSILYLAEIGQAKEESLDFIRDRVKTGTLYNAYDTNGNPLDKSQSAASYAIVAMIAREINDEALYHQAMMIVRNFQITSKSSLIYGGIGDPTTLEVYSYNNLMAQLAYDY